MRTIKREVILMKVLLVNGSPQRTWLYLYGPCARWKKTLNAHKVGTGCSIWAGSRSRAASIAHPAGRRANACSTIRSTISSRGSTPSMPSWSGRPYIIPGRAARLRRSLTGCSMPPGERRMKGKLGAAIVSCRRGGATAAFDRLNSISASAACP